MTKFIMIFTGRCGGSFLMYTLNLQKNSYAELEMLNKCMSNGQWGISNFIDTLNTNETVNNKREGGEAQIKNIETLFKSNINYDICGFSTKYQDIIFLDQFKNIIENDKDIKIIYNYRYNIIKQLISLYNFRRKIKEIEQNPLKIDLISFCEGLRRLENIRESCYSFVFNLNSDIYKVSYEELLYEPIITFTSLCNFLNVKFNNKISNTPKKTNDDLKKAIYNYQEVYDYFKNTKYKKFFEKDTLEMKTKNA